jgi:putative transposase
VGGRCLAYPDRGGPLWLASVRDAFSRRVVGWKASDRADTDLVLGALEYALWSRQVQREQLVFHSDHGAQTGLKGSSQRRLVGVIVVGDR